MTIINKQYNYVFIHIPKSAGKSIKKYLTSKTFSLYDRNKLKLFFTQQALSTYASATSLPDIFIPHPNGLGVVDERLRDYCLEKNTYTTAHLRSDEIVDILGEEEYKSMFSFAFVRNPWDRCLSAYFYFKRKMFHPLHDLANQLSFEDFLLEQELNGMPYVGQQTQWIYRNGQEKMVDFIGKVECIEADMTEVNRRIGLHDNTFAERANVSGARERDYRPYYSARAREIVERSMRPDIQLLDYTF